MAATQWMTYGDSNSFIPAGDMQGVVKKLAPGVYKPVEVPQGFGSITVIKREELVTDNLLVIEDSPAVHVISSIEKFQAAKAKFAKHKMVHKRTVLMEGPPGTGKTSIANIISQWFIENNGVVFIGNANNLGSLLASVQMFRVVQDTPLLVLLEDFDQATDPYESDPAALNALMMLLDGQDAIENVVYLLTTNYIDRIDHRFVHRPCRVDEIVHVGEPSATARRGYLSALLREFDATNEYSVDELVAKTEGLMIAHLREFIVATLVLDQPVDAVVTRLRGMLPKPGEETPTAEQAQETKVKDALQQLRAAASRTARRR